MHLLDVYLLIYIAGSLLRQRGCSGRTVSWIQNHCILLATAQDL